ncbi:MAG: phosphoribosylformylglycinamidine synthase subunit PurS [Acidobacteriota bacterium]
MSKKKQHKARVRVVPRPEILDPQGKAVAASLGRIGFDQVTEVRVGKSFDISLEAKDEDEARELLDAMADKLLANGVVEDFEVEILGGDAA